MRTNPGLTTTTRAPEPARESPRPWKKASIPALEDPYTKLARRTLTPATDESATSVPWPCRRRWVATAVPADTAPR